MPFLSMDWRGPGEDWVKSQDGGWETRKVAQFCSVTKRRRCQTEPGRGFHNKDDDEKENCNDSNNMSVGRLERYKSLPQLQPFCPITIKCTREVAGFNTLADVLKRLDFRSAVHDVRRFHYVSSLLRLLLSPDKLFNLPGASQRIIFRILEEMAMTVFAEKRGEHVLKKLLQDLHTALDERTVWGSKHGSQNLVREHTASRRRIACIAALEQKKSKGNVLEAAKPDNGQDAITKSQDAEHNTHLDDLPEECIREILLRLSDSKDLERAGETMPTMSMIVGERRIWRELVQAHFSKMQIECVINKKPEFKEDKNWSGLYQALKRHFGLRQEFTELVMLCKHCRVLFWQSYGHPCLLTDQQTNNSKWIPLTPSTFLTFFSV